MSEIRTEFLANDKQALIFPCPECSTEYAIELDAIPTTSTCPVCGEKRTWDNRPAPDA